MSKTIYFYMLLFCGISCQEIFATLSDKDTKLSSNILSRKRRVMSHLPGGRNAIPIENVNYIVRIRENHRTICAGVILSHYSVITAALCVIRYPRTSYDILSGANANIGYNSHNLTSITTHGVNLPDEAFDGIALVTVDPPFVFDSKTGSIELYTGPYLHGGTLVKVFGWGYMYPPVPRIDNRTKLRSIILPILNHATCQHFHSQRLIVTAKHICTYHPQEYCCRNDEGAPLVYENKLVGIHIFKEEYTHQINPDIFIDLQTPDYKEWILANALLM